MTSALLYVFTGIALFCMGFYALILHPHLLRKILAINVMSSGVFMLLVALADRSQALLNQSAPDPVPHAMVITGIVVAVSATALALTLMLRVQFASGRPELIDDDVSNTHDH
ncbi:sodium:proton antiporter [sulfur-oxidizing endosymbiont of Gigantopelta aegis]|uniref:sodium:proton antiporter n=1 Tax=sulfur-oxidizing endosymbiont of Gigantopelta aegis TaxID=2794934 RepID=UPI0018DEA2A0|nr:NADH-quinone oxidoreductase subunit K [sulfur-oxidizing endosymbiont of Gigantopelta aegis]